mmetsp:Transcript_94816/g.168408  ORF Transcript_94816/g.168408 Transcript_94816/m.168408 type:complete len:267 (-) Transcript_94816:661-1461(-)
MKMKVPVSFSTCSMICAVTTCFSAAVRSIVCSSSDTSSLAKLLSATTTSAAGLPFCREANFSRYLARSRDSLFPCNTSFPATTSTPQFVDRPMRGATCLQIDASPPGGSTNSVSMPVAEDVKVWSSSNICCPPSPAEAAACAMSRSLAHSCLQTLHPKTKMVSVSDHARTCFASTRNSCPSSAAERRISNSSSSGLLSATRASTHLEPLKPSTVSPTLSRWVGSIKSLASINSTWNSSSSDMKLKIGLSERPGMLCRGILNFRHHD